LLKPVFGHIVLNAYLAAPFSVHLYVREVRVWWAK